MFSPRVRQPVYIIPGLRPPPPIGNSRCCCSSPCGGYTALPIFPINVSLLEIKLCYPPSASRFVIRLSPLYFRPSESNMCFHRAGPPAVYIFPWSPRPPPSEIIIPSCRQFRQPVFICANMTACIIFLETKTRYSSSPTAGRHRAFCRA